MIVGVALSKLLDNSNKIPWPSGSNSTPGIKIAPQCDSGKAPVKDVIKEKACHSGAFTLQKSFVATRNYSPFCKTAELI